MSVQPQLLSKNTEQTEHPHIVRVKGIGNGEPIIKGTRVSVRLVAEYYKSGIAAEEIQRDYPYLNAAAIFDAISYYIDHQKEIEKYIEANKVENVLNKSGLKMDEEGVIQLSLQPQNE